MIDAARDLVVASRQNTASSESASFNFSVTVGPNGPTGMSLGGSLAESNRRYTDTPTTVEAEAGLDVRVGRATYLAGAMLNARSGKLKLDTGSFTFDHYNDADVAKRIAANGYVNTQGWDARGSVYYKSIQAKTFATVSAGEIKIRDNASQNLIALNREPENLQKIISKELIDLEIPGINLAQLSQNIKASADVIRGFTADIPDQVRAQGDGGINLFRHLVVSGMSTEQARLMSGDDFFRAKATSMGSLAAKQAAGIPTDATERTMVAMGLTILYGRNSAYAGGSVVVPCPTNGTKCEVELQKYKDALKHDPNFIQNAIAGIVNSHLQGIDYANFDARTPGASQAASYAVIVFDAMLQCAIEEPAVFDQFVGNAPWAGKPAGFDDLVRSLAQFRRIDLDDLKGFSREFGTLVRQKPNYEEFRAKAKSIAEFYDLYDQLPLAKGTLNEFRRDIEAEALNIADDPSTIELLGAMAGPAVSKARSIFESVWASLGRAAVREEVSAVVGETIGAKVWALGAGKRGNAIEKIMGRNLHPNYPVIDRFMEDGVATSIKSLDLDAQTYQTMAKLESKLRSYVNKVSNFNGANLSGTNITSDKIRGRALEIVFPHTGSAAQQQTVQKIIQYANSLPSRVMVNVRYYP